MWIKNTIYIYINKPWFNTGEKCTKTLCTLHYSQFLCVTRHSFDLLIFQNREIYFFLFVSRSSRAVRLKMWDYNSNNKALKFHFKMLAAFFFFFCITQEVLYQTFECLRRFVTNRRRRSRRRPWDEVRRPECLRRALYTHAPRGLFVTETERR